jgi:hypothetical protein
VTRKRAAVLGLVAIALASLGGLSAAWLRSRRERVPTPAEVTLLETQRDSLQRRLQELVGATRTGFEDAPPAGLLLGIPTEFTRDLAQQVVTGLFGQVTLRLRNLKLSKSDEVQARVLFSRRTVGQFVLDVSIPELVSTLRLRQATVSFAKNAKNRLGVSLRAALLEGGGVARVQLQWDSRGMANAICGDIDVTRELRGAVVPAEYLVQGGFDAAAHGGAIVLRPRFGEVALTVRVRPSEDAWIAVDSIVDQQSGLCRAALRRADVKTRLREMLERGFTVKLPERLFREIRLPAGVQQSLELQGATLLLSVKPVGLVVGPQRIWYGADVTSERRAAR